MSMSSSEISSDERCRSSIVTSRSRRETRASSRAERGRARPWSNPVAISVTRMSSPSAGSMTARR
jgi:hypothetical protein